MSESLRGRNVVLGVTGSIAAFKAVQLASDLVKAGALVDVVMTEAATRFVTPLSFRAITHRPVVTDLWAPDAELEIGHVTLGRRAEVVAIAPATADAIARLAHGLAGDAVGTTVLSSTVPLLIAPAMEPNMWAHPATQANVALLRSRGAEVMVPGEGRMASGHTGRGRMPEPSEILAAMARILEKMSTPGDLAGRRMVVTAGGTQEPIDPVRYIGNRSSGKMGFALAEAARDRGAIVTLVVGPSAINPPSGFEVVPVKTTLDLQAAVRQTIAGADALVMAAAPADFRVERSDHKIKRGAGDVVLRLVPNPDILASIADWTGFKVGFAAETDDLIANARKKLASKKVDVIVLNDVSAPGSGFGSDTNQVTFVFPDGRVEPKPLMSKRAVADAILDLVVEGLKKRASSQGA